jgi:hypothetical protein
MFTKEQEEAEDFVIKVYKFLQQENPEYRVSFFSFLTLAAVISHEMGMGRDEFIHYADTVLENNRDMKMSELQ